MNTGTILIVDDNKGVLASLELLLENYFSKILTASNPNQITALLTTRRIDVVILDMNFSAGINNGNEGLYWLGHIRQMAPTLPVVMLTAYDDLFQTDESRAEAALSKIRDIPLSEIDEFPDHPFKVLMDEDMEQLVESIKRNGVMTPATVRLKEDGRYELISGHRRRKACELAGLETLKCEVKDLSRDEAIIIMVESNLQRSTILPSEKAFAYKMRLEAMKRQAGRPTKDNYSPMGNNLEFATSSDELAEKVGESKNQIFRFIRLTELVPEILQMVDERQIAFRPAVEISYLTEEQQYTLLEAMEYNDATPSLAQAIKMKKFNQDGKLTDEVIQSIMEEEKPNQKEKPAFRDERITKLIPKTVPKGQETDFVVKALEFYNRHLQRNKAHER